MPVSELITKPLNDLTFAVVDTETSGMNPQFSRVMDIGIILVRNGEVLEEWETLIDPEQEVPYWISKYTHLTYNMVKGMPTFKTHISKIKTMLNGSVFVGHNVMFDYSFLYHEMLRENVEFSYPKLCTVLLGRKLLPHLANAHLDALADYYNIKISQRHRALPDAKATAIVLNEFIKIAREKYNAQSYFDLEKLQTIYIDKKLHNTSGIYGGLNTEGLFDF